MNYFGQKIMKTKLIFKCARCGTEYEDTTRRFSFGRYKWHTIRYSQYSESEFGCVEKDPVDLCDTCYDALRAFMKMDDSAEYYNNEIKDRDRTIKTQKGEIKRLKEHYSELRMQYKDCKTWCPKESEVWQEFVKKHNDEMIKDLKLKEIY